MPTFVDPKADASEAYEALRGLAHATRAFDDPSDAYAVLGDLLAGVRSLQQVLDQLATVHGTHRVRARDDAGNQTAGAAFTLGAADELRHAAALMERVHDQLDAAMSFSGRIAWLPEPADTVTTGPTSRWISVVFLQGEEADRTLDIIDTDGTDAAIEHLAGYDFGEETVQSALANGYVYDNPPTGALDHTATRDIYALTYNPALGHVSLLRQYAAHPDPELLSIEESAPARLVEPSRARETRAKRAKPNWFGRGTGASSSRGLAL